MKKQNGFFIIEIILYVALVSWLFLLIFQFISNERKLLVAGVSRFHSYINLNNAADIFMRDIRQAPASLRQWKNFDDGCIIWHSKDRDIGWEIKKDKMIRIYGIFVEDKNKWKGANRSCMVPRFIEASFTVEKSLQSDVVKSLIFHVKTKDASIKRKVFLKNEK